MARISRDDVAHVADLARLRLSEQELEAFTGQLAAVLDHAADGEPLDVEGVGPPPPPDPRANLLRDHEPRGPPHRDEVLAQAPDAHDGRFRVPPVLGEAP